MKEIYHKQNKILEVENLFTNVFVNETIYYFQQYLSSLFYPTFKNYPHKKKKTAITMSTKKKIFFLLACTRHVPLNDHLGNIYSPTDGVAMGSPPGT